MRRLFLLLGCLILITVTLTCIGKEQEKINVLILDKENQFEKNINNSSLIIGKIDDFCLDSENNIYIADSGFNQVHKFDPEGNYLLSYGKKGQGPGEFMANPLSERLRISTGNDQRIYVYETGNNRISVYESEFKFIKGFSLPIAMRVLDSPSVSSKGDIFLVARIGDKLIQKFDNEMNFITSFLGADEHFRFPFHKPQSNFYFVSEFDLRKKINRKDQIVAVSNYSLNVFIFDADGKMIRKFAVDNNFFIDDFKKQIDSLKKDARRKQGIILPFYLFIDNEDRIILAYYRKELANYELYCYTSEGSLQEVIRFPEKVAPPFQCDKRGNIYAKHLSEEEESLRKYKLSTKKEGH